MEATQLGWMTLVRSWMIYNFPSNLCSSMKTMIQVCIKRYRIEKIILPEKIPKKSRLVSFFLRYTLNMKIR